MFMKTLFALASMAAFAGASSSAMAMGWTCDYGPNMKYNFTVTGWGTGTVYSDVQGSSEGITGTVSNIEFNKGFNMTFEPSAAWEGGTWQCKASRPDGSAYSCGGPGLARIHLTNCRGYL